MRISGFTVKLQIAGLWLKGRGVGWRCMRRPLGEVVVGCVMRWAKGDVAVVAAATRQASAAGVHAGMFSLTPLINHARPSID
jgi:hypothetical protein